MVHNVCPRCQMGHKPKTLEHVRCNACIGYTNITYKRKRSMECQLQVDPLGKFPGAGAQAIVSSLGLIPDFVMQTVADLREKPYKTFMDVLEGHYGFPASPMEGTVEDDIYKYPQDEDLYPLAKYEFSNGTYLLQFKYGILSYIEPDKVTSVRMD